MPVFKPDAIKKTGASASSSKTITDPHIGENKVTKVGTPPKFRKLKAANSTWSK